MPHTQNFFLTQLQCQRCRAESFVTQIELDQGDWIATCPVCQAAHIVALPRIKNVAVLLPALPISGWRT